MECERIFERDVEIARVAGVVWRVQAIAKVTAYHHHAEINAESDTGAERDVAQECLAGQQTARTHRVILEKPDVAGVEKGCAMEYAVDRKPVFGVEFKLECTGLIEISVLVGLGRAVAARTERTHGEGAYRVCAADIELLGIGHSGRVAVGDTSHWSLPRTSLREYTSCACPLTNCEKGMPNRVLRPFTPHIRQSPQKTLPASLTVAEKLNPLIRSLSSQRS